MLRKRRLRHQPTAAPSLRFEDGFKGGAVLGGRATRDEILIVSPVLDFFAGVVEAFVEGGFILRPASIEPIVQFFEAGRHDEDVDVSVFDRFIPTFANGGGALHIKVHEHVRALLQMAYHGALERAVVIVVNLGVFEELLALDAIKEFFLVEKVIVSPIHFPGSGRPCGA